LTRDPPFPLTDESPFFECSNFKQNKKSTKKVLLLHFILNYKTFRNFSYLNENSL
jgi:hypothetical protein